MNSFIHSLEFGVFKNPNLARVFEKSSKRGSQVFPRVRANKRGADFTCVPVVYVIITLTRSLIHSAWCQYHCATVLLLGMGILFVVCQLSLWLLIGKGGVVVHSPVPFLSHNPAPFLRTIGTQLCLSVFRYGDIITVTTTDHFVLSLIM